MSARKPSPPKSLAQQLYGRVRWMSMSAAIEVAAVAWDALLAEGSIETHKVYGDDYIYSADCLVIPLSEAPV